MLRRKNKLNLSVKNKKSYTSDTVSTTTTKTRITSSDPKRRLRRRMFLFVGLILFIIFVIFIVTILMRTLVTTTYTYEDVEIVLRDAAIDYMRENPNRLPVDEEDVVVVNANSLISGEHMLPFDELLGEGSGCNGHVEVIRFEDGFRYIAHLNCASGFRTMELHRKIGEMDIVETGTGLYNIDEELVFRGEHVNNFVLLDNSLWRIVRLRNNNDIVIVNIVLFQ
jgi:hypothetical protein